MIGMDELGTMGEQTKTETSTMLEQPKTEISKQWPQYLAVFSVALLSVSCGLHFGWPSPAVPKLLDNDLQEPVTKAEVSYIVLLTPIGYIIGSPLSSILLDKIGRKASILTFAFPQIAAWILIACSTNLYMIYAARLIVGLAEGGAFTAIPVYIAEVSEPKIRGFLGSTFTIALIFGTLLINCYGSFMPIRHSALVSISIPLLFLMTFIWMPDSPYYLLMKGQTEKARKSLKRLRHMNDVEVELTRMNLDVQRQISEPGAIKDIFLIQSNLKAFLIVLGLRTLQQFSGGATISFYNQLIFKEAGGEISYTTSSIIYTATLFLVGFCGMSLIDRFGRKPVLIVSALGSSFCMLAEGIYFSLQLYGYNLSNFTWLPVAALTLYTVVRGIGVMSIPAVMAGELFSASIKAKALGMVSMYFALCVCVATKAFHILDESFGMHAPFFMFVFVSLCGLVFIYFCVPETKGKTLEQIQQKLKGNTVS